MLGCRVPQSTRRCDSPAFGKGSPSAVWPRVVRPRRGLCHPAPPKAGRGGDGKKDDKADIRKADTSAYWALKVREFFSPRKKYLDQSAEQLGDQEPEVLKRVQRALEAEKAKLESLEDEQLVTALSQREDQLRKQGEAGEAAAPRGRDGRVYEQPTREEITAGDIGQARRDVRREVVGWNWAMTSQRVQRAVLEFVLLPITLLAVLRRSWADLFASQRYENFLMAEGERIWYWRNRTENERWFWEIFAWDRLVFPIICAYAYQRLVPANFVWSVIIPLAFIYWQDGQIPGFRDFEFWLVFYFGFWQKCMPDFVTFVVQMLHWA